MRIPARKMQPPADTQMPARRYEVRFTNEAKQDALFGRANDADEAQTMINTIDAHPDWKEPRIIDRQQQG